jgi:hypothetical protein
MFWSGPNLFNLPYYDDERVKVQELLPIPGVLDVQIDNMAIQYMLGQMKLVIKRLKTKIFKSNCIRS